MRVNPKDLIRTINKEHLSAYQAARRFGIHRSTVYRWLRRAKTAYGAYSSSYLERRSTRPHAVKSPLLRGTALHRMYMLRKETEWTAEKLVHELGLSVSSRTVHRALARRHLVREYGYHRRPRFQDTIHMHAKNTKTIGYLQMDVKYVTPELSGLTWTCFEYAVIDIFSRYKEAVILNHLDEDGAMSALLTMLPKLPFKPVFLQTDNGLEFQGRFHGLCEKLGLRHHFIHKNTPNENALIERSFRTDEEEFFFRLKRRPVHYDELREWFVEYLRKYNTWRPHLGIGLRTPLQAIHEAIVANVMSD